MGQNSHRKYKEYREAKEKLKSYSSDEDKLRVRNLELEYKLQEKEDQEDFDRSYKLLTDYEY